MRKPGTKYQYTTLSIILTSTSFLFFSLSLFLSFSFSLIPLRLLKFKELIYNRAGIPWRSSLSIGPLCLSLEAGCLQLLAAVVGGPGTADGLAAGTGRDGVAGAWERAPHSMRLLGSVRSVCSIRSMRSLRSFRSLPSMRSMRSMRSPRMGN